MFVSKFLMFWKLVHNQFQPKSAEKLLSENCSTLMTTVYTYICIAYAYILLFIFKFTIVHYFSPLHTLYVALPCHLICHSECVALQDPYCAWDKIAGKCRSHGAPRWLEENYFYQNVATGQHAACPSGK